MSGKKIVQAAFALLFSAMSLLVALSGALARAFRAYDERNRWR
ncbi:hypothetical protein QG083_04355 [Kingella kingae]|nr:hypothetical protein [Kingella kingae]MDK4568916.1 hypothetical protein [Kingella kingae]MDK4570884.1 hypothetical protein [Kingella kingae]MDK4572846.1 hypothetical protein [Kingella kingae]MDK4580730.1 hypothetical protein [Kingella kingae]MDK4586636.1 hypothetical protein [Kingella kingae]